MTTALIHWLSPSTMQALGWTLLHFLWQGTALAALAAGFMALSGRPQVRYRIGVAALVLMFLAPVGTFVLSSQPHSAFSTPSQPVASAWAAAKAKYQASAAAPSSSIAPSSIVPSLNVLPWLVEAWLLGVAIFSLRSAGGFFLIERERRRQSNVVEERVLEMCYELQDRLGIHRVIEYWECTRMQTPAVIGWFRPIVFLPVSALTGLSEEQLQSIIAHELAHIQRLDPFVNVFQVCVETLLFYHPAVWWLNKRIRTEREHCCDEMAVLLCGNAVDYARALTLMEEWRSAPVLAMAANRGPLTERVIRVLGMKTFGAGMRGIGLTGSILCLTAALVAGNALLGFAHPKAALASSFWQATPKPATDSTQAVAAKSAATPKPSAGQSAAQASSQVSSASSYIDQMKGAGLGDLTLEQLIALKSQDVDAEYVRGLEAQGLHPDVDGVIGMKVQDVTPEYVREWREAGLNPDANHLIGLKVQDVDAAYYRGLKDAGINANVDQLIGMKVQGVTPEYVREMRAAGMTLNADQVIGMKVQGVTPQYLKEMHDQGVDLDANTAIGMRVQDVTPEYIKEMRALGLKSSGNELIGMRVQDVTPEYVRAIQALGLNPSTNELIGMKVQDVTPEYIKALQSAGFKVGVNEIIGAKVQDVTPEFIEQARKHGFKDLTLQKLIQLRQLGILESKADL